MPALKYWLWLSAARVGCRAKANVLAHYGDAEAAFLAPEGDFKNVPGLNDRERAALERRDCSMTDEIIRRCTEQGISIICYNDAAYPKRLKNIYAPPPVIYVKGSLSDVDRQVVISVIGTRKATPYGIKMSRSIAQGIARSGGTVLSLLGSAVDTAAWQGALAAGGFCLAVLPGAHEKENQHKLEDFCKNGAVISEYAPGTETMRHFFRERNRIAAAISVGVVVVEAPEKSGTRLFADEAAEMGKEIFALPGNADAESCAGTLQLLKEGAKLVTNGYEVTADFAPLFPGIIREVKEQDSVGQDQEPEAPPVFEEPRLPESPREQTAKKGYADLKEQLSGLNEDQLKILMAIDSKSVHVDDIIADTGISAGKVLAQLTVLELKGFVKRESGRRVSLNTAKK